MADPASTMPSRLLDRMREALRVRHYSYRMEQTYRDWARWFMLFHRKRHPAQMGAVEVGAFLTHLAAVRQVSASTQNQAKAALLPLQEQWVRTRQAHDADLADGFGEVWLPDALAGK